MAPSRGWRLAAAGAAAAAVGGALVLGPLVRPAEDPVPPVAPPHAPSNPSHPPPPAAQGLPWDSAPAPCPDVRMHAASTEVFEPLVPTGECRWRLSRPEGGSIKPGVAEGQHPPHASDDCPWVFARSAAGAGGHFDLTLPPHTLRISAALPPAAVRARVQWCAARRLLVGCRICGYSCNQLPRGEIASGVDLGYPVLGKPPLAVLVEPGGYRFTGPGVPPAVDPDSSGSADTSAGNASSLGGGRRLLGMKPGKSKGGKGRTVRPPPWMRAFGAELNPAAATTAARMGFRIVSRPKREFADAPCAARHTALTFFFGRRVHVKHVQGNIGHWLHDILFPVFSTIHNHVDLVTPGAGAADYQVAAWDTLQGRGWTQEWAIGGAAHLLNLLTPRRVPLRYGSCFARAVFDCPAANEMRPTRPLQIWLSRKAGFSFAPLPARDTAPNLALMLRRPGGSRFLSNWVTLTAAARGAGWNVTIPVDPKSKDGFVWKRMHEILPLMQRTHCIAGIHGTELTPMLFMPNGSVVIEMLAVYFRYLDGWYIRQAEASGLHLVRYVLGNGSVAYADWGSPEPEHKVELPAGRGELRYQGALSGKPKQKAREETRYTVPFWAERRLGRVYEFGARSLRSNFAPPTAEWLRLLQLARSLLLAN
eukprot:TRINITY_DN70114_c0_g1_i1.p1 TRINITY_DN70114_c0_g1~~TRINITY_DN70114_c0_g1_i1.p1  ORF type:complete len:671 (+),score=155.47 TRINITY_DN70114_c0_g1_i1:72-2015(+)